MTKYDKAKEVAKQRGQLVEACPAILIFVHVEAICLFCPAVLTSLFTRDGQVDKGWLYAV